MGTSVARAAGDSYERCSPPGEVVVQNTEDSGHDIHDLELHPAEVLPSQHLPIQPPGRRGHPVEVEDTLNPKALGLQNLAQAFPRVPAPVAQSLVQTAIQLRVLWNQ